MLDGVEDAHVASAAAEVSVEPFVNLRQCRLRMFLKEVVSGEDHAGSADAALRSTFLEEAPLNGVKLFVDDEAFDGCDPGAIGLQDGDEAGVDQISVDQDGAGSALAFSTTFLGSGEVQVLAENVEEVELLKTGDGPWRALMKDIGSWNHEWNAPGVGPVEYLDDMGFLDNRLLAVHGVQMSTADLERLKERGTTLVTCPRSNGHDRDQR